MAAGKSFLSAGELLRAILMEDGDIAGKVTKIYPVVTPSEAKLPYIVYSRSSSDRVSSKSGNGTDTAYVELAVYTSGYTEGVELAEAVRGALDGAQGERDGMVLRSCVLSDSSESWAAGAYGQFLTFRVRI